MNPLVKPLQRQGSTVALRQTPVFRSLGRRPTRKWSFNRSARFSTEAGENPAFPTLGDGSRRTQTTKRDHSSGRRPRAGSVGPSAIVVRFCERPVRTFSAYLRTAVKRTFQPNVRRRAKKHGFRARMATAGGRAVLKARRAKGRARISA